MKNVMVPIATWKAFVRACRDDGTKIYACAEDALQAWLAARAARKANTEKKEVA